MVRVTRRGSLSLCSLVSLIFCAACGTAHDSLHGLEQQSLAANATLITISFDDLDWAPIDGLPNHATGGKVAMLTGDLSKAGRFVLLTYLPPHYQFPAHWHDADEDVTVLDGSAYMGGEDGKPAGVANGPLYKKGGFHHLPATHVHWLVTENESAVIKVASPGPYGLHWVEQK